MRSGAASSIDVDDGELLDSTSPRSIDARASGHTSFDMFRPEDASDPYHLPMAKTLFGRHGWPVNDGTVAGRVSWPTCRLIEADPSRSPSDEVQSARMV